MNEFEGLVDHYETLQVSRFADDFVIKAAYRVLASHLHPDKHQDDPVKTRNMQSINEAYAMLIDPVKRAGYDRLLQSRTQETVSNSDRNSDEYFAGKLIGKMIIKELFKRS